jgi:GNAT superfamily N-acetyltransferase
MTPQDIPFGMKLKSGAGWNQVEADWEMLLEAGGDNFMAGLDEKDAGVVVSVPYQDRFTWIAMVLVDPEARRKGVGRALIKKSLEIARPKGAIRLDATPEGFELYRQLGFQTEYELVRFTRTSAASGVRQHAHPSKSCHSVGDRELDAVLEMDKPVFGADRSGILRSIYGRHPEYACCLEDHGTLKAYCLGRSGSQFEHIGPMVAEKAADAGELLAKVLSSANEKQVAIDVPAGQSSWISLLTESGFNPQRTFTRMCLGQLHHWGIPDKQFAIAGPEIG